MISYNALQVEGLREVLQNVSSACIELNIDFFLVGAVARNIWYVDNKKEPTGTRDIDFGVYVSNQEIYDHLKQYLKDNYKYIQSSENAFGLDTPDGKRIDLMPFGEIATNGEIILEGSGMTKIRLDGFDEAFKKGTINAQLENETYRACSIPGIVILKLIAYDDRPDRRIKDIFDITRICKYYPDIETDLIWDNHNELYVGDLSHDDVGMIVLGREMNKIISENEKLKSRIIQILEKAINRQSAFLELMITNNLTETLDEKAIILKQIKQGLEENT